MELKLYDTLTRPEEAQPFKPIDPENVRIYVCGPTVYDFAHIGNARPVIVFDVLFRLLRHIYGADHVTYVRNITDVDDKINARAAEQNISIRELTEETYKNFKADVAALGCLPPTVEPRATEHIEQMKFLIDRLVAGGHAYVAEDNVLFNVPSMPDYGRLSNRPLDEMIAGARVEVAPYKKDPTDFVLWKPSKPGEPAWASPAGIKTPGRPGWHIECSAMADYWLWTKAEPALSPAGLAHPHQFDIHGGGIDLVFPHHENEIAQSRCAFHTNVMANYWMHNGFVQVEGKKMAKSEGNFVTINELLHSSKFGGRKWNGETIRFAMLQTPYREPIDWTVRYLEQAESRLKGWKNFAADRTRSQVSRALYDEVLGLLANDLDTPAALNLVDRVTNKEHAADRERYTVYKILKLLGFKGGRSNMSRLAVEVTATANNMARFSTNDWNSIAAGVRFKPLLNSGKPKAGTRLIASIEVLRRFIDEIEPLIRDAVPPPMVEELRKEKLEKFAPEDSEFNRKVEDLIARRNAARKAKDFKESDRIRDELAAMGVVLKDSKDGTTWEIAR